MNTPHFHTCSIPGCGAVLPVHMLMCRFHWRHVPYRLRADVWAAWEQYRCGHLSLTDLREVQKQATDAVVEKIAAKAEKGGAA